MKPRCESPAAVRLNRPRFTLPQEAAIAKLAYAAEHPGAIALLCGPAGVGKTMVLRHVAAAGLPTAAGIRMCAVGESCPPPADVGADDGMADMLLVDDADRLGAAEIVRLVEAWRGRRPGIVIVLAGRGRLLSLCSSDHRLEQSVRMRATLPPFTMDESRDLLRPLLRPSCGPDVGDDHLDDVLETIHDIAAGVPAAALRLADMAAVIAAADPARRLHPDDVEAIHRRLCLHAA